MESFLAERELLSMVGKMNSPGMGGGGVGSGGHDGGLTEDLHRKIEEMEQEQEELNDSLMSMTSHFAKVSLRALSLRIQQFCVVQKRRSADFKALRYC